MQDAQTYAQRLHEMVDGPDVSGSRPPSSFAVSGASAETETRSLENPNIPITAEQLSMIWGYGPTRSGVQINEHTALTHTAVFAAIRVLAESIGMLPLVVYQGDPDSNERVRATWHPLYGVLRHEPNPEMSAVTFKETLQGHLAGWGNGYARILEDYRGQPRQLLPLAPDRTHPERYGGQLRYTVDDGGGIFAADELVHVPGLGFNGIRGYGPIALARESLAVGKAAEIFGATFFGNGAQLGGVLEVPGKLNPEQLNTMRESWNAMHAGPGNSHKTGILQNGTKWSKVGIPPEDAQFIETRKFGVTEVARIFRIPPHMLADLERATFSNIEQMSLEFLLYTLSPWLTKWEQELTRKLFPAGSGYFVEFDIRLIQRADVAARREFYAAGRQWGWFSANDVLKAEGLPGIGKDGDVYLSPINMTPVDRLGQVPPPVPPPAGSPTATPPPPPAADDSGQRSLQAISGVFEDAVGRMLRKEANAASRGKADDRFYAEHRSHVAEALWPAARALMHLSGRVGEIRTKVVAGVIDQFASQRHTESTAEPPAAVAGELLRRIYEAIV